MSAAIRFWFAILFALILCLPAAAEGARVILVLDGSGSMWGQVSGKAKIAIAKQVVGKIVGEWKPEDELGLVVYGHRQKGACEDIEVMRQPGRLDASAYMKAVKSITPKGKTPMTAAVKMAAESLKFTEKASTVILVSDGIETCGLDPCAVAEELKKLGVELVVHTVGFGLDNPEAKGQLQCMADRTGGISVTADNADELEAALKKTVEAAETPPPAPEPAKPAENLKGHVRMAENVELPEPYRSATWDIAKALADGSRGEGVAVDYGLDIKRQLEPGDYTVKVTVDTVSIDVPFAIAGDQATELQPSLEAGIVNFSGKLDETTPLGDGAAWEVGRDGRWITTKYGATSSFLLAAGDHTVKVTLGSAVIEQPFKVDAGKIQDIVVTLGAGRAVVSAVFDAKGTKVERDLAVEARKGEAELSGEHGWIATQYNPVSSFDLPAGKYLFTGKVGYATGEQTAEVKAGQKVAVTITLNAGYLAALAPGASSIEIQSGDKDVSGQRKYIGLEYTENLNAALNAGRYHLIAMGKDGALLGEKDVEVKAGERTEVSIP